MSRPLRPRRAAVRGLMGLLLSACSAESPAPPPAQAPADDPAVRLVDVTAGSGVDFVHDNGRSASRYLPETMGAGVAVLDADGDGASDLFFVQTGAVGGGGASRPGALYRNLGGLRFADVTDGSGLDAPILGQGVAAGDVDNDGDADLLVTGVGGDHLYLNQADGTFSRRADSGLPEPGFSSSAAFVDVDRDGLLDLLIGRYVTWSPGTDVACRPDGENRTYCTPEVYSGASNRLLRNRGGGRFLDVTEQAGLARGDGKTLGVVPLDANRDGWPDLAIANDTTRNFLFVNRGDGTFSEEGAELGVAVGPSGAPRGSMGIDVGDVDGDGGVDFLVANFAQEMSAVFLSTPAGLWSDGAASLGIGLPSLMTLAFGSLLADLDSDGALDVILANGHIEPEIERYQATQSYAQPLQVFRGATEGFEEVSPDGVQMEDLVGRALAAADLDGDGDLDLVVTQNGRSARIVENRSRRGSWVRLRPVGSTSNRSGYGLEVSARVGERRIEGALVSGRSYLTAPEPILTLGTGEPVQELELRWPSGRRVRWLEPPSERLLVVPEPEPDARERSEKD